MTNRDLVKLGPNADERPNRATMPAPEDNRTPATGRPPLDEASKVPRKRRVFDRAIGTE